MTRSIRPATAEDHDRLHDLDVLTWSPVHSPGPPPPVDRNLFERRPPADHLLAEVDGTTLTGYIVLGHASSLASNRHVIQVQGLAVHPDHGGRGIGRALVGAAVEEARRRGARKVSLRVLSHNAVARRLYERAGFGIEGRLVGEFILDGEPVDDLFMALHLT